MGAVLDFDRDKRRHASIKFAFEELMLKLTAKGFHPAQVAMDLADIVEEYIMEYPVETRGE